MKSFFFLALLPGLCSVWACHQESQPAPSLSGKWEGTLESTVYCTTSPGKQSVGVTALWQVYYDSTVSGSVTLERNALIDYFLPGTPSITYYFDGTIRNGLVTVEKSQTEICSGVNRTFKSRYTGKFSGYELTLTGRDTLCEDCMYQRTLRLVR